MSCADFAYGDTGVPIYVTVAGCGDEAIGSDVVAAVLTFTGPTGLTFDRNATVVSGTRVRYTPVSGDYAVGGFSQRGVWNVQGRFTMADDRSLGSLECASFTIR